MIGRTLKQYEIEDVLGKGGMGTVYRARDTKLHRPVALKILAPELTTDPDRRWRFFQEARSAAAINHPAIAQIYDIDEVDGVTFIAMELVDGETVRQLITNRDLDLLAALEIAIQVGEGLVQAHGLGIIHRDIKSENIMVTRDGRAKLLDFGLAKLDPIRSTQSGEGLSAEERVSQMATVAETRAGLVVGTVAYMSPEQARGREIDYRSDIFSLGVTMYEMVCGKLPFRGDSPLDTMHAIAFEETRPITVLRQNLPPELQRIVSRCLRKRPEDRYPDAASLVADLKALKRDTESGVTRMLPLGERVRERFQKIKSMQPSRLAWIAAGAVAAAGIFAAALMSNHFNIGSIVFFGIVGLVLYRFFFRNRKRRLMRRFAAKVAKFQEVRLITLTRNQATVVVERSRANIYLRVNGLMDGVNKKLFFGDPIAVAIRDDVPGDEFRGMLQEPGILFVREDSFEEVRKV